MTRHSGKNGIVQHGANTMMHVTNWTITETSGTAALTAAGDAWGSHDTTFRTWTATVTVVLSQAVAANQGIRSGTSMQLSLYTEGNTNGRVFYRGTATCTSMSIDTPFDNAVTRTFEFEGNGALDQLTVPA
jgi:hypothetical protein